MPLINKNKTNKFSQLQSGLSLREVLILIAFVCLLIALLLPAFQIPRTLARRILCGNHIKYQLLAIDLYAAENNDRLPIPLDSNNLNEISEQTSQVLLQYISTDNRFPDKSMSSLNTFYCPSNSPQQKYKERFWNWYVENRSIGYYYLIDTKKDLREVAQLADTLSSFNVRSRNRRKNFQRRFRAYP